MKKFLVLIIILLIGSFLLWSKRPLTSTPLTNANVKPPTSTTQTQSHSQTVTSSSLPKTLHIPSLNLTAPIESVGLDRNGNMDTPQTADDVAWYNKGYKIGDQGSAVIAGHYDRVTGAPAVFYNLGKITSGSNIEVTMSDGKIYTYKVTRVKSYPDAQFPLQEVFNTTATSGLNLITCDGVWNKSAKNYSNRLVVYSELVQ